MDGNFASWDPGKVSAVFEIEDGVVKTGVLLCADDGRKLQLEDVTVTVVDGDVSTGSVDLDILFGDNVRAADFGTLTLSAGQTLAKGTQYGWRNADFACDVSWRRGSQPGAPVVLQNGDCLYYYFGGGTTSATGKVCVSAHFKVLNPRVSKKTR